MQVQNFNLRHLSIWTKVNSNYLLGIVFSPLHWLKPITDYFIDQGSTGLVWLSGGTRDPHPHGGIIAGGLLPSSPCPKQEGNSGVWVPHHGPLTLSDFPEVLIWALLHFIGQLSVQGFLGSVVFLWTTLLPLLQKLPYKKKGSGHFLLSGMFEDMEFCLQRQKYFPRVLSYRQISCLRTGI